MKSKFIFLNFVVFCCILSDVISTNHFDRYQDSYLNIENLDEDTIAAIINSLELNQKETKDDYSINQEDLDIALKASLETNRRVTNDWIDDELDLDLISEIIALQEVEETKSSMTNVEMNSSLTNTERKTNESSSNLTPPSSSRPVHSSDNDDDDDNESVEVPLIRTRTSTPQSTSIPQPTSKPLSKTSSQSESNENQDTKICSICIEEKKLIKFSRNCKHQFCEKCCRDLKKSLSNCPTCLTPTHLSYQLKRLKSLLGKKKNVTSQ
ncbi:bromodomain-containing protein DDB_G0270170-like isoform X8 [Daktulosphaira vitifoliae]|uniref:bromodomain-containing protein DDB_G0270170-like isoform X8 n=1 Tax=Daktulosphaira vitifoliae TaxID=58002 RepID=UPI0021AA3177|nr:bromodomain-containing protein DDB_G0270170-like isoform X8 [Daktulosphaira vitifoliae]